LKSCHCLPLAGCLSFPLFFVLIRSMPAHKFGILWVSEQTPQSIDHEKVPHH
jgi:hypothetical protein